MLTINKTIEDGKALFTLDGRLDTTTAPALEKELKEALPGVSELTLDFAALEYISSAGLLSPKGVCPPLSRRCSKRISLKSETAFWPCC